MHIYIGEADRCKPCACVEHRDSSMRVARVEQPKSVGSELLPVGLSYCQITSVLHLSCWMRPARPTALQQHFPKEIILSAASQE